jgi:hypothetical protein
MLISSMSMDSSVSMQHMAYPARMTWLADRPDHEAATGCGAAGWESSTRMAHDELHHRGLDAGDIAPLIIGHVSVDGRRPSKRVADARRF